jgi:hypothetical protein
LFITFMLLTPPAPGGRDFLNSCFLNFTGGFPPEWCDGTDAARGTEDALACWMRSG